MKLTAELESTGGTTTGFRVPDEFVAELGGGGRPKVTATVNGHTWQTSIAKMGGEYWLGVSAANRTAAEVEAGELLDVEVVLDTAVREIEVPADLAAALAANPAAQATWDKLSFSNKRYHAEQITGAKTDATRERRVAKSVQILETGKPR
jgi:hypothetical protein